MLLYDKARSGTGKIHNYIYSFVFLSTTGCIKKDINATLSCYHALYITFIYFFKPIKIKAVTC